MIEETTVEELLDAVESEFNATLVVLEEDGDPVEDEDTEVTEDMVVKVTAEDEDTVAVYEIIIETD